MGVKAKKGIIARKSAQKQKKAKKKKKTLKSWSRWEYHKKRKVKASAARKPLKQIR